MFLVNEVSIPHRSIDMCSINECFGSLPILYCMAGLYARRSGKGISHIQSMVAPYAKRRGKGISHIQSMVTLYAKRRGKHLSHIQSMADLYAKQCEMGCLAYKSVISWQFCRGYQSTHESTAYCEHQYLVRAQRRIVITGSHGIDQLPFSGRPPVGSPGLLNRIVCRKAIYTQICTCPRQNCAPGA